MIKTTGNILEVGSKLAASYITKQIPGFQGRHFSIILRHHSHLPSRPSIYHVRKFVIDHSYREVIIILHSESNVIK